MSQIIKSFLGVFLILFLALVGFGILGMYLNVVQAQNLHARVVCELEDSNFYPDVMRACFTEAEAMGYDLSLTMYESGLPNVTINSASEIPWNIKAYNNAKVTLLFGMNLPVFGIGGDHVLEAYTR